jgi:ApaG protein
MKKITFPESEDVMVTVDSVTYQPLAQTPEDRPYCFVYVISIWNHSEYPITVVARKWVVRNSDGNVEVLEGKGVVGLTPRIEPGDKFTYNSFHLLRSLTGEAEGSYVGIVDHPENSSEWVLMRIPKFDMEVPETESWC